MEDEIKELKEIEKSFIIGEDAEKGDYVKLIRKVMDYAKVDDGGYVVIDEKISKNLVIKDRILLILITRYLGNKLQEKLKKEITISPDVSADELAKLSNSKKSVIHARVKELKDLRKVIPSKNKKNYSISPHYIRTFLEILESKSGHK